MEGISVEQAVEQILQHTPVINETEETELNKAGGRVLAQDMVAGFDNPPFDRSPVDGYACKAEDLAGAAKEHPVRLKVMEEIDAGQYSEREIQQGQAVRMCGRSNRRWSGRPSDSTCMGSCNHNHQNADLSSVFF